MDLDNLNSQMILNLIFDSINAYIQYTCRSNICRKLILFIRMKKIKNIYCVPFLEGMILSFIFLDYDNRCKHNNNAFPWTNSRIDSINSKGECERFLACITNILPLFSYHMICMHSLCMYSPRTIRFNCTLFVTVHISDLILNNLPKFTDSHSATTIKRKKNEKKVRRNRMLQNMERMHEDREMAKLYFIIIIIVVVIRGIRRISFGGVRMRKESCSYWRKKLAET